MRSFSLDENGIVRLDSRTPFPEPTSRADRDYFEFHQNSSTHALHISRPIIARSNGTPVIAVSRRLSNPDGTFAGVVVGSVRLSYFQQLFKNAALGPNGNISLFRTDGMLLDALAFRGDNARTRSQACGPLQASGPGAERTL